LPDPGRAAKDRSSDRRSGSGQAIARFDLSQDRTAAHDVNMRFFDSWWEHVPTVARLAPFIMAVLAFAFQRPMDYYWE
jgi:hypothetical protein